MLIEDLGAEVDVTSTTRAELVRFLRGGARRADDLQPLPGDCRLGCSGDVDTRDWLGASTAGPEELFQAAWGPDAAQAAPRLTHHLAAAGEDVAMIRAKGRHRSLGSLERYANASPASPRATTPSAAAELNLLAADSRGAVGPSPIAWGEVHHLGSGGRRYSLPRHLTPFPGPQVGQVPEVDGDRVRG